MAKQLTAPGCKYSIVARVDTTIYSPDQKWILDVPAGQTDFIAETNEIIIPADAMMCRKKCQIAADLVRFNILGRGAGSLATFVTRAIEQIVGKGNAKVEYGDGKMTVVLAPSVTAAQFAEVENLLGRLLPKDVEEDIDPLPSGYTRVEFLESTGTQYILAPWAAYDEIEYISQLRNTTHDIHCPAGCSDSEGTGIYLTEYNPSGLYCRYGVNYYYSRPNDNFPSYEVHEVKIKDFKLYLNNNLFANIQRSDFEFGNSDYIGVFVRFTKSKNAVDYVYQGAIYRVSIKSKDINVYTFIPCLDDKGIPCMFDMVTRQTFRNNGTGQFIVGLTMAQALDLANLPVPTTSNTLTISLPKEASLVQHNQEVEVALSIAAEKGWQIAVQYRDEFENESILNKYAECVTRADMLAVNPDYKNDFTGDGEWIYPLTKMEVCSDRSGNPAWYLFENVNQKRFITEMPAATVVYRMFNGSNFDEVRVTLHNFNKQIAGVVFGGAKIKKAVLVAPKWEDMGWLCNQGSIETLEIDAPVTRLDYMAPIGTMYKLKNVRLTTTQLSTADGAFANAQLTRESALHILDILPTYTSGTHKLTIGIHIDYQFDEEVLDAITNAEEKGWTLTVQWNPGGPTYTTPEASTFGLRKPSIYAKLATMEHPDGTLEEYLDWGHYVTNWEENGYQEFASIEEAEEYFNIKKEVEK